MAEGGGLEPPVRFRVHGLAIRCITALPSLRTARPGMLRGLQRCALTSDAASQRQGIPPPARFAAQPASTWLTMSSTSTFSPAASVSM